MSFAQFSHSASNRDPQAGLAATAQAMERVLVAADPAGEALRDALHALCLATGGHRALVMANEYSIETTGAKRRWLQHLQAWGSTYDQDAQAALQRIEITSRDKDPGHWIHRIDAGETVRLTHESLTTARALNFFQASTRSITITPVIVQRQLWGIVVHENGRADQVLSDRHIPHLQALVYALRLALERKAWRDQYADLENRFGWTDTHAQEAVCVHDHRGRFKFASSGIQDLLGEPPELLIGQPSLRGIDHEDRSALLTALARLAQHQRVSFTCRYHPRDGSTLWVQIDVQALQNDPRGAWLSWTRNVNEREHRRNSPTRQQQSAEVVLSSIGDGVITTDARGAVDYMNRAAEDLTGVSRDEASGRSIEEVFPALPRPHIEQNLQSRLLRWMRLAKKTWNLIRPDGTTRRVEYSLAPLMDDQQQNLGMALSFRDVGATEQLLQQLEHLSSHDVLTGLYDRPRFMQYVQRIVSRVHERNGECFLACIGLDQMKLINDGHGHAAGDEVLKQAAAVLNAHASEGELVARLGGDEFSWLIISNGADQAVARVEELLERLKNIELSWAGRILKISASAGMAVIQNGENNVQQALAAADTALALAKEEGRGKANLYRPEDRTTLDRHGDFDWTLRLQAALETDGFFMQAQPIVPSNWKGEPIRRAEVLIALQDTRGGLIPPGKFLPAAARTGLIGLIDRQVIRRSIETLRERERRGLRRFESLAVNISGASLGEEDFLADVLALLREVDDPGQLTIEITESEAVSNLARAQHFIDAVRRRGTRFALDDFGSGLSSFAYLKALPVDYLKIDGLFVRDVETDPIDRAFVEAIHKIARTMGIKTVAEFVENGAIQKTMENIGVDFCQGFHISRPRPIAQVLLRPDP